MLKQNLEGNKEHTGLSVINAILKQNNKVKAVFQQIVFEIPKYFTFPADASARIIYGDFIVVSPEFKLSEWRLARGLQTFDGTKGLVEIFYQNAHPEIEEGPFTTAEADMLNKLIENLERYINVRRARNEYASFDERQSKIILDENSTLPTSFVHQFITKSNKNRDIYHDLMPFKVQEILMVSTLYDAFSIESEGRFFDDVLGEYQHLNLSSIPRITAVSTISQVFESLKIKHYDFIILMTGMDHKKTVFLMREIKKFYKYIPIYILFNNQTEVEPFRQKYTDTNEFDGLFVWNGDSNIFFAMIKSVEDRANLVNDTAKAFVRVILFIEDNPRYYSKYLPVFYKSVMEQTRLILRDVKTDDLYKVLRMRTRPKIIHARNYEEAIEIIENYRGFLLTVITDMEFTRDGVMDPLAGNEIIRMLREHNSELPIIIQSSEEKHRHLANSLNTAFVNKNKDNMRQIFSNFIKDYLGFGNFVFKTQDGETLGIARSLDEFLAILKDLPPESLHYHASRNHFSLWLMARGEVGISKIIRPSNIGDFGSIEGIRSYLMEIISEYRSEKSIGKILPFEDSCQNADGNIITLSNGLLGGKGRGIAFINLLVNNFKLGKYFTGINIKIPKTFVIGTDIYDEFMQYNSLSQKVAEINDYQKIRKLFLKAQLPKNFKGKLRSLLTDITKPIAVRSSGLNEDSLFQPFAGVFETYMLPNNHENLAIRVKQLEDAIKMVYSSIYSSLAKGYIEAIHFNLDEEKMAIVIQEIVGNKHDDYFYPHISGVAQSYNFYPYSHMKPEDGYAVMALGMGSYVVEGREAHRFCPKHPALTNASPIDQIKESQSRFLAVYLKNSEPDVSQGEGASFIELSIKEAEKHGILQHLVSTYDANNDRILPGLRDRGPKIVNFANILQYNHIPLAQTIDKLLGLVREAMGTPVEIEFAVDIKKDKDGQASLYILQIKPLVGNSLDYDLNVDEINLDDVLLFSEKGMGNGMIEELSDIIYVDIEKFDKSKTKEIAIEIEAFNERLRSEGRKYLLIGPGRWGTRDEWLGIPVTWPQISNAKVVVETDLKGFPLESSSGSHFFHNVISMNVGYFSVQHDSGKNLINYNYFNSIEPLHHGEWLKHIRLDKNFTVKMDGKKGIAVVLK